MDLRPPFCREEGRFNLVPNFHKGGFGRTLIFRGGLLVKRGVIFFGRRVRGDNFKIIIN